MNSPFPFKKFFGQKIMNETSQEEDVLEKSRLFKKPVATYGGRKRLFSSSTSQSSSSSAQPPSSSQESYDHHKNKENSDPFEIGVRPSAVGKRKVGSGRRVLGDKTNMSEQTSSSETLRKDGVIGKKEKIKRKKVFKLQEDAKANPSPYKRLDLQGPKSKATKKTTSYTHSKPAATKEQSKKRKLVPRRAPTLLKKLGVVTLGEDMEVPFGRVELEPQALPNVLSHATDLSQDDTHSISQASKAMSISPIHMAIDEPRAQAINVNENNPETLDPIDSSQTSSLRSSNLLDRYLVIPESPTSTSRSSQQRNPGQAKEEAARTIIPLSTLSVAQSQVEDEQQEQAPPLQNINSFIPLEISVSESTVQTDSSKPVLPQSTATKVLVQKTSHDRTSTPVNLETFEVPLTLPSLPSASMITLSASRAKQSSMKEKRKSVVSSMQKPGKSRQRQLTIPDDMDELLTEPFDFVCRVGSN